MIFSINFALNVAILSLSMRTYFVFLKFHKRKNINKLAFLEIILSWYRRKGDCKKISILAQLHVFGSFLINLNEEFGSNIIFSTH